MAWKLFSKGASWKASVHIHILHTDSTKCIITLNQQHSCYRPSQNFSQGNRLSSTFINKLPLAAYSAIVKADGAGAVMVTTDFLTKTTGAIILLPSCMRAHHLKFQAHSCILLIEKHPGLPTEYDEVGYAQFLCKF